MKLNFKIVDKILLELYNDKTPYNNAILLKDARIKKIPVVLSPTYLEQFTINQLKSIVLFLEQNEFNYYRDFEAKQEFNFSVQCLYNIITDCFD